MSQEIITFSLDTEKIKALDEIASVFSSDRTSPLKEAIAPNPQLYQSQPDHIKEGLRQADAGEFASDKVVATAFAKWCE